MLIAEATFDPASVAANTSADNATTINVPGANVGDLVIAFKPTTDAGLAVVDARVSAADTIQVTFMNSTASPVDASSESWKFLVIKPDGSTFPGNVL